MRPRVFRRAASLACTKPAGRERWRPQAHPAARAAALCGARGQQRADVARRVEAAQQRVRDRRRRARAAGQRHALAGMVHVHLRGQG